jgi:chemotaxis protein MotB
MTLLVALFMVLFSISSVNKSKLESLQHSLQDAFSGKVLPGGQSIKESGGTMNIKTPSAAPKESSLQPYVGSPVDTSQSKAATANGKAEEEQFKKLKSQIDSVAAKQGLSGKIKATVTDEGLVIRLLTDKLLFASGDATVQPAGSGLLAKIGGMLRAESQHAIRVRGFTDSVPIHTAAFPSNWELSAGRAASVVRAFAGAGVAPQRMEAAGRAALDPLNTNVTAEGRARNRRVEVLLPRVATGKAADDATQPERQPRFAPDFGPESLK